MHIEKPELIFHIGTSKAGSTSLQKAFDDNIKLLHSEGVFYPQSPYEQFGKELKLYMADELLSYAMSEDAGIGDALRKETDHLVQKAVCKFDKSGCNKMLISHEVFYGAPNIYNFISMNLKKYGDDIQTKYLFEEFIVYERLYEEKLKRIKELLEKFNIKIVCYLRRQDLYIESMYNQMIKTITKRLSYYNVLKECKKYQEAILKSMGDEYFPFYEFVDKDYFHEYCIYKFKNTCYYENICLWADIFGKENIILKPFEKGQFKHGLVKDFFIDILKIDEGRLTKLKELHINEKISRDLVEYVARYEPPRECYNANDLYDITRKLKNVNEYQQYFTLQERTKLMNYHEEGNKKIAKEFLGRNDGVLFYEEIEIKEKIYPGLSNEIKEFLDNEFKQLVKMGKTRRILHRLRNLFESEKGIAQSLFAIIIKRIVKKDDRKF